MADLYRGALALRFQTNGIRYPSGTRQGAGGQFRTLSLALLDNNDLFLRDNEELAKRTQEHVVEALDAGIRRRGVSTGRLKAVTAAPENIHYDRLTWGVGVVDFLNRSEAKYWRTIDQGSAAVWSTPFVGHFYFVNRFAAFGQGVTSNGRTAIGPYLPTIRGGGSGKLATPPVDPTTDQAQFNWRGKLFITKEIAAEDYYQRGFEKLGSQTSLLRVYSNRIDKTLRGQR